ncbi:hypothetical protein ASE19_13470 [Nocardioides sp. Root79]|nr:hypothetical protein ASE19_13470 [Nocardioides sp. Root79]KRC70693.1 hypothetical protein ASE20_12315 [Nocardioides sp. Root240]
MAQRRWRILLVVPLMCTPLAALPLMPNSFAQGIIVGVIAAGVPAGIWNITVSSTSTSMAMMGDEAERWTAQELRRAIRGDATSYLVNRVPFGGHDIDHVLMTPAGLFIVETKWSSEPWSNRPGMDRQQSAREQVEGVARKLTLWADLKALLAAHAVPVTRIVALWGGDRTETIEPQSVGGTAVMHGSEVKRWIRAQPAAGSDGLWRDEAWSALSRLIEKRERHDPTLTEVPRSLTDHLSRIGVTTASAVVIFLGLSTTFTSTHSALALIAGTIPTACIAVILRRRRLITPLANGALIATGAVAVLLLIAAAAAAATLL